MKDKYTKCEKCFCHYEATKEHECPKWMLALRQFELDVKLKVDGKLLEDK